MLGQDKDYPATNIWGWNLTDPRNQQVNVQADHYKYAPCIAVFFEPLA